MRRGAFAGAEVWASLYRPRRALPPFARGEGGGVNGIAGVKVDCDCGFMVGSHDEREVAEFSIIHVKNKHGQTISLADARKKMKPL